MRAALITTLGEQPSVGDVPAPEPADGEILVEVLASALNPIDIAVGGGRFFAGHPPLPYVPGAEAVGRVIRGGSIAAGALVYLSGAGFKLEGTPEELAERFRAACGGDGPTYVDDPLWGAPATAAVLAAAPGARIVNLGQSAGAEATLPSGAVRGKQLELFGYLNFAVPAAVRAEAHAELLAHVAAGRLHVALERVALADVAEAWTRQASGADVKLVVEPRP